MPKSEPVDPYDYAYAVELARSNGTKAIRKLAKLIDSKDERIAVLASNAILDRAYGKARQHVEHSGTVTAEHRAVSSTARWLEETLADGAVGAPTEPRAH